MAQITLTINGKSVTVEKGLTVLQAARQAGIHIPTVCAHEDLPHYGSCRMCIVEIEKVRGYPTSCTTPAEDGMVVKTDSPEITTLRNRVMELMLSGHPNACLVCDHREQCEKYRPRPTKSAKATRCTLCSNRDSCELRSLAFSNQSRELNLTTIYNNLLVDKSDPFMDRDYNLCILCGRCWRICENIHGKPAISIVNRGKHARPGTSFNKTHVQSGCTFCGACIDICPTGTLTDRYARWYGKPDEEVLSTCTLCPRGCTFWVSVEDHKCVGTRMKDFQRPSRLCAMGRFAYAQLINTTTRLRRPATRNAKGELTPAPWEDAVAYAARGLKKHQGGAAAVIAPDCELREVKFMYERLARKLGATIGFIPASGKVEDSYPSTLKADLDSGKIKAVVMAGNYLDAETLDQMELVVLLDWSESPAAAKAHAILPTAILSEVEGTFHDQDGEIKQVTKSTEPPGEARQEWQIICDLGRALGGDEFNFTSARDITPEVGQDRKPAAGGEDPRDGLTNLPVTFKGHYIADSVCALEALGLPMSPPSPEADGGEGFLVLDKQEVVPNFHLLQIEAPQVAKFAQPGQFVILMVKETSERVPFTLIDWDAKEGTITLVVEEVGRSSREVAALKTGDRIAHVTGPLGTPFKIEKVGTVVLGGGCYGVGAIYPIAKAMREAGNRVVTVVEASSHFLLYWREKLTSVSDRIIITTKDGSLGRKGGVQDVFVKLKESGKDINMFVAIGCTFMMRMVAEATEGMGIPTYVALNPIMVDGTGMCGACRVSVGGDTKFACVDGPIFDAHQVDWDELFSRRGAYATVEVAALPQNAAPQEDHGHQCAGNCKR